MLKALVFIFCFLYAQIVWCFSDHYSICPSVYSAQIKDPNKNRSIVVNYNKANGYYVFLRCGSDDSKLLNHNKLSSTCHIYREGFENELCALEKKKTRANKFVADAFENLAGMAVTGGASNVGKLTKSVKFVKDLKINPECIGLGLMKAIALEEVSEDLFERYYDVQVELGPFSGLAKLITKSGSDKSGYILGQLDGILIGGNGSRKDIVVGHNESQEKEIVKLRGPAYFTTIRTKNQTNLMIDESLKSGFCSKFNSGFNSGKAGNGIE